jgi:hypothetical protein
VIVLVLKFVLVWFLLCIGFGLICGVIGLTKYFRERRLANRWKENADPFIGAP